MPHRWVSVAILVIWAVASVVLVQRDVLPELLIGPPPDMRSVASAEREAGPTRWSLLVADDPSMENLRSVGQAITESIAKDDGWLTLSSKAWFDSGSLLKGTPFAMPDGIRIDVTNACEIDPSGNPRSFRAVVHAGGVEGSILNLHGLFRDRAIELTAQSRLTDLSFSKRIPYEPKTLIQSALAPLDRIPGLAVGQRWEARVISPLTGQVETVRAEVTRRSEIYWDRSMVATYELVQKIPPTISARTWVRRSDGLVLRQEVPIPLVKLVIERMPRSEPALP